MSINSAKTGSTGLSLALDNNYMEPIASVLVGAGESSSIIFNDIPQGYKNLQIRGIAQFGLSSDPGGSGPAGLWFNNDYGTNYTRHYIEADGATAYAYGLSSVAGAGMERFLFRQTNNNIYGAAVCDILDYANPNKFKTIRNIGGFDTNSASNPTGDIYINSSVWMSKDPITSITIGNSTWKMKQHTRFSLYGIKG
jgi:hypothetical protein